MTPPYPPLPRRDDLAPTQLALRELMILTRCYCGPNEPGGEHPRPALHNRRLPRAPYVDSGLFAVEWETNEHGIGYPRAYATATGAQFVAALHRTRGPAPRSDAPATR